MPDLQSGAKLFWSPSYLAGAVILMVLMLSLLRVVAPKAFVAVGYRNLFTGYLALLIFVLLLLATTIAGLADAIAAFLIAIPITLVVSSVLVAPIVVGLEAINRNSAITVVFASIAVVLVVGLLFEINIGPTVHNGLARWIGSIPYVIAITGISAFAFCLGARISIWRHKASGEM